MNNFVSLAKALEGYFDKPLNELPNGLRERVLKSFPMPWDKLSSDQRRSQVSEWDYLHDPAVDQNILHLQQRYRVSENDQEDELEQQESRELIERKYALEKRLSKWEKVSTQTASDLALQENQLDKLTPELDAVNKKLFHARGDYHESERNTTPNTKPAVSAAQIKLHFTVFSNEDTNHDWWKKMMSNASDNGLNECRVGGGRKGPGGSLWRPDLIAVWLTERVNKKLKGGMSRKSAHVTLKKFSGYEDIAEELFPSDE